MRMTENGLDFSMACILSVLALRKCFVYIYCISGNYNVKTHFVVDKTVKPTTIHCCSQNFHFHFDFHFFRTGCFRLLSCICNSFFGAFAVCSTIVCRLFQTIHVYINAIVNRCQASEYFLYAMFEMGR